MRIRNAALALLCILALWAPATQSFAQAYPTKMIKLTVPFPAGGAADVLVRLLTKHMSEDLGQQFLVENKPGAGGALAFEEVARAAPDGYSLIWTSAGFPVMAATVEKLNFNPAKDFVHISQATENSFVLVINPSLPAKSVKELIALAKEKPNTLNFAHNGTGTLSRLAVILFKMQAGIEIGDVSYRGDNFSVADVIAGHVHGMFSNAPVALPHVADGRLRALAVTAAKRSSSAPELPTMIEAGLPDFAPTVWQGLSGPAGLPRPIIDRLHASVKKALATPDFVARAKTLGVDIIGSSPDEYQALVLKELTVWADVVKRSTVASK